ncbi:MAG: hypothetical protein CVV21_02650 [Candidatus Goldiibacteriota bacterium HGW-Goldbacteria-1]|jgi:hypothetical protein|nr:MAG: hypothetical protein CVV21_02650 [Candidatus Goldiibacteriota bacterium HGW-Goldbacteria-1]
MKRFIGMLFLLYTATINILACPMGPSLGGLKPSFYEYDDSVLFEGVTATASMYGRTNDYPGIAQEWEDFTGNTTAVNNLIPYIYGNADYFEESYYNDETKQYIKDLHEVFIMNRESPYGESPYQEGFDDRIKVKFEAAEQLFIKKRYAYLFIRVCFSMKKYNKVKEMYESVFLSDKSQDIPYYRSRGYYAGSLLKLGDKTKAIDEYITLYNEYPNYRGTIKEDIIKNSISSEIDGYAKSTTDTAKKYTVAYISGNLDIMTDIGPQYWETLSTLHRRFKAFQRSYLANNWKNIIGNKNPGSFGDSIKKLSTKAMNNELALYKGYFEKILAGSQSQVVSAYCNACLGYICSLEGDWKNASKYIKKAKKYEEVPEILKNQVEIFMYFNELAAATDTKKFLKSNAEDFNIFAKKNCMVNNSEGCYGMGWMDNGYPADNLMIMLAQKFYLEGDKTRSAACFNKTCVDDIGKFLLDMEMTDKEFEKTAIFITAAPDNEFDGFLKEGFYINDLKEWNYLLGVRKLREKDFVSASKYLNAADRDMFFAPDEKKYYYYDYNYRDNRGVKLLNKTVYFKSAEDKSEVKNKKEIAEYLEALEKSAKNGKDAAENYFKMGLAYYSCPYIGYSDILWNGGMWYGIRYYCEPDCWITRGIIDNKKMSGIISSFYEDKYNRLKSAREYFIKAEKENMKSGNKELSANCLIYTAQTKVKTKYTKDHIGYLKSLPEYKELINNYLETETVKNFVNSCSWFASAADGRVTVIPTATNTPNVTATVIAQQTAAVHARETATMTAIFVTKWETQRDKNGETGDPKSMTIDSQNNIIVVDNKLHNIQKYSASGALLNIMGSVGADEGQFIKAAGIAADSQNDIYIYDNELKYISKFSSKGEFIKRFKLNYTEDTYFLSNIRQVCMDSKGFVYLWYGNKVLKVKPDKDIIEITPADVMVFDYVINGIAVDSKDNLYLHDEKSNTIHKIRNNGKILDLNVEKKIKGAFWYLRIAVDRNENIYLVETDKYIAKYSSKGKYIIGWQNIGTRDGVFEYINSIDQLAVDRDGYLYALAYASNGRFVLKFKL